MTLEKQLNKMNLPEIVRILQWLIESSEEHRLESGDTIVVKFKSRSEIERELKKSDIVFEKMGRNEISVNVRMYSGLFYDREHFLAETLIKDKIFDSDIGIVLFLDNESAYYESSTQKTYINFNHDPSNHFIQNACFYWKFFENISSSKIIAYHSIANREFVVVSPEKGEFMLGYPLIPPQFSDEVNLEPKYNAFQKMNESQEFRAFFKGEIIDSLAVYQHDDRFIEFINNIESIIEGSNRNYEVFLNKFSFEQLKKNFRKERDEYFSAIRDIVNQLLSKIVSIPLSISASALAIYNLRDEPTYSFIVVVAFIIYSCFTSFLLRLHHSDTLEIDQDLINDIAIIEKSSNIPPDLLQEEIRKVTKKIDILDTTIIVLQILLIALSLAVSAVFLNFIAMPTIWTYLILLAIAALQLTVSFWRLVNKKQFRDSARIE